MPVAVLRRPAPPPAAVEPPAETLAIQIFDLSERKARLRAAVKECDAEISRLSTEIWNLTAGRQDADLDAAAAAMADGRDVTPPDVAPLADRISDLQARRDVTSRALRIVTERLTKARRQAAGETAAALRPQHRAATLRVARALVELHAANVEVAKLHTMSAGALPNTGCDAAGDPRNAHGCTAFFWFDAAVRGGFITGDDRRELLQAAG